MTGEQEVELNRKKFMQASSYSGQPFLRIALVCGCVLLIIFGIINSSTTALASGVPGGNISNPVVRAVHIAKPAVVRIITTLGGHLTVHFNSTQSADFPQGGGAYPLELSGSGAFITSHGDILTADHVVRPPHDQELDSFLFETAAQDIADYINQHFTVNPPYASTDVVGALTSGFFRSETHYDQATSEVFLSTDYTGPLNADSIHTVPSDIHAPVDNIEQESAFNQEDVAIVHVNMDDTPSVSLGDSSSIEPQDELVIIGFPGNGDVSRKGDPTQVLTSSVNRVYVSSIKKTDEGAPVIQAGGNVENGDSGGPALDSNGNIVGVVSFFLARSSPTGSSFLQASNSARDLARLVPLDTKPGPFEKAWQQAFNDYASTAPGHWHKALQEFKLLVAHYSNFVAVQPYLLYAQDQANREQVPQTGPDYTWAIVAGALLLLLVIGIVIFVIRRRRKRANSKDAALSLAPTLSSEPVIAWGPIAQPVAGMQPMKVPSEQIMVPFDMAIRNGLSEQVVAPLSPPTNGGRSEQIMTPFGLSSEGSLADQAVTSFDAVPASVMVPSQDTVVSSPFSGEEEEPESSLVSTQPYPAMRIPPGASDRPRE